MQYMLPFFFFGNESTEDDMVRCIVAVTSDDLLFILD